MSKNLIILVGPPGSGKSTLAKQYSEMGFTYINQDLQGKGHLQLFEVAVASGLNVVVDRMNFSKTQRSRYLDLAKTNSYWTSIMVLHESYLTCLERCLNRKGHPTITDEYGARSALGTFFSKYERPLTSEADNVAFIYPSGPKPKAIICDLDGTLCNVEHRRHFVRREGKKDWAQFFEALSEDTAHDWCSDLLFLMGNEFQIVYASGRTDNYKKETRLWLEQNDLWDLCKDHLYMRPRNDSRQDYIVKEIILDFEILTRFTPHFFIDDRQQVVDMWRSRGFTCLQCDKGDF